MNPKDKLKSKLDTLSADKRAWLEAQLRKKQQQRIPKRAEGEEVIASYAQQRLWFLEQLYPGRPIYNTPFAVSIEGLFQVSILEDCVKEIIQRHEVLRTTFVSHQGKAKVRISDLAMVDVEQVDLTQIPVEEREEEFKQQRSEKALKLFDLEQGPLLEVTVWKWSQAKFELLFNMHHIVADGWSTGIMIKEMMDLYEALAKGAASPFTPLEIQYADYALWQHRWLKQGEMQKQLSYWKKQLSGDIPLLSLSDPSHHVTVDQDVGAAQTFTLPATLVHSLKQISDQAGCTMFMTLLTIYNIILARYTGENDILVGTPIANRTVEEVEPLIGFFVNTLVIRNDLSGNPTFLTLLQQVKERCTDAYANQDVPFEKIVQEIVSDRSLHQTPLFQTFFVLNQPLEGVVEQSDLKLHFQQLDTNTAKFDLSMMLHEDHGQLIGKLEYRISLFSEIFIQSMIGHFFRVIEQVVEHPTYPIHKLAMLTSDEQHRILFDWNQTNVKRDEHQLVHTLFEAQAHRTPDAHAVVFKEQSLTYKQLNAQANRVAHQLLHNGFKVGDYAGLCMEKSLEMVIAMLAIVKAGGAYVALDPNYPEQRLHWMMEDADLKIILTCQSVVDQIPAHSGMTMVIDGMQETEEMKLFSTENPCQEMNQEHAVYVLYTSGSTGKPKGVEMPHRALVNLLLWQENHFYSSKQATTLQFASVNFDVSFQEIFSTWCTGGTLIIPEEHVRKDFSSLLSLLQEQQVERIFLPFVAFHHLAEVAVRENVALQIREVISAGEQLQITPAIRSWMTTLPDCVVQNQYGPSETHVVTSYQMSGNPMDWETFPSIGYPIDNTSCYIVDEFGQPVPVGVAGELYIGGMSLARGYVNRPTLTDEKFLPNTFLDEAGQKMYRTGDLARFHENGAIEFLQRIDQQVKVRGHRVELGEIEAALLAYDFVREATVIVREDIPGDRRLVAYFTVAEEKESELDLHLQAWQKRLENKLPEYMIPSTFMVLDRMPLSPNLKLDRKALPKPEREYVHDENKYVTPETETEQVIAQIWGDVLHVERIGKWDHFFELGGHSLLATQAISRMNTSFSIRLPLKELFEHPTCAALAAQVDEHLLHTTEDTAPIKPVSRQQHLPLSYSQERLWVLHQLLTDQSAYNMPGAIRFQGEIHVEAMKKALQHIVDRHEVLRTTFQSEQEKAVQIIHDSFTLEIPTIDLSSFTKIQKEEQLQQRMLQEATFIFDLVEGPLIHFTILKMDEKEHILLINMHHMISDGWSIHLLINDFTTLYKDFSTESEISLEPLPIQYADYAVWQREQLHRSLQEQIKYWEKKLGDGVPPLQLPTDYSRPSVQTYEGSSIRFVLPSSLTKSLKAWGNKHDATLYMVLMAAFQALLYRYSGQQDFAIGTPVAGRQHQDLEKLIGFFVNTLVITSDTNSNVTASQLLGRVRQTTLAAFEHQDVPFEYIVKQLHNNRDLSVSPLFQVMFALQNVPSTDMKLENVRISQIPYQSQTAKFDLTLSMTEEEHCLTGVMEFNKHCFRPESIQSMIRHFQMILEHMIKDTTSAITQLPLLTKEEEESLIARNNTTVQYPRELTIHEVFERVVEHHSNKLALQDHHQSLTYQELNDAANQLAHQLRDWDVKHGDHVGVCMERSADLVISLLAILKVGAVYVPFDLNLPEERFRYMLEDAEVSLMLTQSKQEHQLLSYDVTTVSVDDHVEAIRNQSIENLSHARGAEQLAYINYTSGSTGKPKGVCIPHRGVVRLVKNNDALMDVREEDIWLQASTISFDAATMEIWGSLLNGACLAVLKDQATLEEIADAIEHQRVTILFLTAGLFHQMIDYYVHRLQPLRLLISGGDVLSVPHVKKALQTLKGCTVINAYGPTENTTVTTCHRMTHADQVGATVSIGTPIANTEVYVLDAYRQPVPIGVAGELYIGGDGLATGYLNRPEWTADTFIPHPFKSNQRLYQSGDIVRYTWDGTIQFIGRKDNQVKIRGFRIELSEIENGLLSHPHIQAAFVMVHEDSTANKQLVAYLVSEGDKTVDVSTLKTTLKDKVPAYMIPSAYIWLEQFPLDVNGKVNRRALPAPDLKASLDVDYVAPKTTIEKKLVVIWEEVLAVSPIGIHDNFFELGGHSLLATQVITRIHMQLQLRVSLKVLFGSPTIVELAQVVETMQKVEQSNDVLASSESLSSIPSFLSTHKTKDEPLPLSFAQERLWVLDQIMGKSDVYNIPITLHLEGDLNVEALEKTINALMRRHAGLRTTFVKQGSQLMQVIGENAWQSLHRQDVSHLEHKEKQFALKRMIQKHVKHPFDLDQFPLIRFHLIRLDKAAHVFVINMHHIISDGWSMSILIKEFQLMYAAMVKGASPSLPALPIDYSDFAVWQRSVYEKGLLEKQMTYWKEHLSGNLPTLTLPLDYPRPDVQTYRGSSVSFTVEEDLYVELKAWSQQQQVTMFMTLFAVFNLFLSRYSGMQDIVVGTPVAGRSRVELEGLVGCFVNTLPIRTNVEGNPTFIELLQRVEEVTLQAYAHQDVPFEKIVQAVSDQRKWNETPLFQVMFALQSEMKLDMDENNLQITTMSDEIDSVKFDVLLSMEEKDTFMQGIFKYNTDLFHHETVERMVRHFMNLLRSVMQHPDERIQEIPILNTAEKNTMIVDWNDTHQTIEEKGLHEVVEEQVKRHPDAEAIIEEQQVYTYRQLNDRANQLAHALQHEGVKKGDIVGLCLSRSSECIISMLAIFKIGAAYLPLDPSYPITRLQYMIDDAKPVLILFEEHMDKRFTGAEVWKSMFIEREKERIATYSTTFEADSSGGKQLAYVMYTSGSTGKPKGVMIEHRSVVNELDSRSMYGFNESDRMMFKASMSFDASVVEIFWPLTTGACVVIAKSGGERDPAYLVERIIEQQVTTIHFVPSMLNVFLDEKRVAECTSLRRGFSGGEKLTVDLQQKWFATLSADLINRYGPTETTINATAWQCSDNTRIDDIPIGRPIQNVQAYVLDRYMQPVPIGVEGELHISGMGLARGYLRRPDLTEEKFVPHPFIAGERLYRTGDMAKYTADGDIAFIGRNDQQIKLRGLRIELGEITTVLLQHPQVEQAVVLAKEQRIVAFIKLRGQVSVSIVKQHIKKKLPDYMVPSEIVCIASFPVHSSGKMDHSALWSKRGMTPSQEHTERIVARNETERQLVMIWERLLQHSSIGVTDHFFELGGHSLLAIQCVHAIEEAFEIKVPLAVLFEKDTIEQLAKFLHKSEEQRSEEKQCIVTIQSKGIHAPLFILHPIGGHVLHYSELAKALGEHQPVYGLQARGLVDRDVTISSIEQMAAFYVKEIKKVQPVGPYQLAGWSFGGIVAFEMGQQLRMQGEQVSLMLLDAVVPAEISDEVNDDVSHFAYDLAQRYGASWSESNLLAFRQLKNDDDKMNMLIEHLEKQFGEDLNMREDILQSYALFTSHLRARRSYKPASYDGSALLIKAKGEKHEKRGEALGWERLIQGELTVREQEGNHYTMLQIPNVEQLANEMKHYLERLNIWSVNA
ncbi:non-ribosomal peptide synthetase [Longirhabdus pacifica]|uniref:non-ribosomal peptide synthetase n=1 Tax=Longirhabdus pacifica TaxID=2305227 RepID=UPI001008AEF4|nr:non-ribosomal peptide synthetase [Longirhabdus pacifica]